MLILSFLLTVAVLVGQTSSINLTYIVKKEGQKLQPNCIAEENERYSAIGWVYPLPANKQKEPNITTKFVPTIHNDFNCKFSKNDKCNKNWDLRNWQIDENSTRTLDLLFDTRWEDLPVIVTGLGAKEFEDKIEIPNVFKAGISVRASDYVEVLLCEGWNPYNYPCYHLNITKTTIFLRKYNVLPKNISSDDKFLSPYTAYANIISGDEWRNFVVSLDDKGVLTLLDVSVNRTVIEYEDKSKVNPIYLLVRSQKPALWKLHQNQFIYTKTPQITRLGPVLTQTSKEMCVAMYISTCPNCAMSFFVVKDNEKRFLAEVDPTENHHWRLIKLKDDHIKVDRLTIFVETRFQKKTNQTEGFWAVDDVRVCHENEVKVTFLKLKDDLIDNEDLSDEISCQVVQHPKWRPKKLVYDEIQDFPTINNSSNSTSIHLNWTQEDPHNQINYFITYAANDLCPVSAPDMVRIKSNGFQMTKHNEISINNLIPYTTYNVTFSSMLHENEKKIAIMTQETEKPTYAELPSNLKIEVKESQAIASWDKIPCNSVSGPILYSIKIHNLKTNTTQDIGIQSENRIVIMDLEPYTTYNFYISTSRNFENIQNGTDKSEMMYKFTTLPGIPPAVENLELYSIGKDSVAFRYDLPKKPRGIPVYVQVTRCNSISFKKCKMFYSPIERCKLYPNKFCVELTNLIPYQEYHFRISIKNEGTQWYGEEVKVNAYLNEKVPAPPTNVTYKIVDCKNSLDYCHLNISWLHPYNQNGTIETFHIVLNGTDNDTTKDIQEVFKVFNSTYSRKYEYQIKYIPYGTHYELYIQSVNSKYKSTYVHTHVKTDDLGDHIDQSPELLKSNPTRATFQLPVLDHRLKSYNLTTIVQDFNHDRIVPAFISKNDKIAGHLCHNFGDTWILESVEVNTKETQTLEVGTGVGDNKHLEPNTQYCITFIVTNRYRDTEHEVVYYKKMKTPGPSVANGGYNHLYILFLLLLLIPIGFFAYRYYKKRRPRKARTVEANKENMYETLPFEECEENCVNNETYDHLLHK